MLLNHVCHPKETSMNSFQNVCLRTESEVITDLLDIDRYILAYQKPNFLRDL